MSSPLVECREVSKVVDTDFGSLEVLRPTSLVVNGGEIVTVAGPSGSGKTTLLGILGLLDRPSSGEVVANGEVLSVLDDGLVDSLRGSLVGWVFQDYQLLEKLSVRANIELGRRYAAGVGGVSVEEALESVGLAGVSDRRTANLSGGEKQRVAIARALYKGAPLMVCDEPTGNLDSATSRQVLGVLREVSANKGVGVLVASHDPLFIDSADRVQFLGGGRGEI